MKKTFFCIATIIFMLSAVSCNKICECTKVHEDPSIPTEIYEMELAATGMKKCSDLNLVTENASGRTTITCVKKSN